MISKLKPYLFALLIISSLLTIVIGVSRAADQTVTCNSGGCSGASSALFSESNAAPGHSATKSLAIKNDRSEDIGVTLSGAKGSPTDDILLDVVDVEVRNADDTLISSNTLASFLLDPPISLGNISAGDSKEIKIALNFRSSAGNDYQDKKATFDILVNVTGDDEGGIGGPSATSTPTPGPGPAGAGGVSGAVAPALFGAATEAFQAELLGISTGGEVQGEGTGAVEGLACADNYYNWWLPLAIFAVLAGLYAKLTEGKRRWAIGLFALAVLSQALHEYIFKCNCATGPLCEKYWIFNLMLLALSLLFSGFLRKSKE